jgi:hypothetical protein
MDIAKANPRQSSIAIHSQSDKTIHHNQQFILMEKNTAHDLTEIDKTPENFA